MNKQETMPHVYRVTPLRGSLGLAVQIVSTFGLAVFLVLYYVLVMQPREQARYDGLRGSVESVLRLVEEGRTLVSPEQSERLTELYVQAVGSELADRVEQALPRGPVRSLTAAEARGLRPELAEELQDVLTTRTRLLRGMRHRDGHDLSDVLARRIADAGTADKLAGRLVVEWPYGTRAALVATCREAVYDAFRK